jgi:predicted SAM-dependent methyltransferase
VRLAKFPGLVRILFHLGVVGQATLNFARAAVQKDIVWADAARRIPLPDASAMVLYNSHMLDCLGRTAARKFLAEAHRVLMPGGILRIALADLLRHARRYVEETKDADVFVGALLLTDDDPKGARAALRRVAVGFREHRWMYDARSLIRLLEACGFRDAVELAPGTTTIPDPGELNLREREEESFYVEARRP